MYSSHKGSPTGSLMGQTRQHVAVHRLKEQQPSSESVHSFPLYVAEVQRRLSVRAKGTVIFLLYFLIKDQRQSRKHYSV